MSDIRKRIEEIAIDDGGKWLKKAQWRQENRAWLRKSQEVALRVLTTLDERGMQQKELAEAMDVSPQQVSKIVKGQENLTLQTISKLERVLEISLFEMPKRIHTKKVEPKKVYKIKVSKKRKPQFTAKEPLKKVANGGTWQLPKQQLKNDNLTLVTEAS